MPNNEIVEPEMPTINTNYDNDFASKFPPKYYHKTKKSE